MLAANKTTDLTHSKKEEPLTLEAIAARIADKDILFPDHVAEMNKFLKSINLNLDDVEKFFKNPR